MKEITEGDTRKLERDIELQCTLILRYIEHVQNTSNVTIKNYNLYKYLNLMIRNVLLSSLEVYDSIEEIQKLDNKYSK